MFKKIDSWWQKRHQKYYRHKVHHTIVDLLAVITVLSLVLILIAFHSQTNIKFNFDLRPINHHAYLASSSTLLLEQKMEQDNIYDQESLIVLIKITNQSKAELRNLVLTPSADNGFKVSKLSVDNSLAAVQIEGETIKILGIKAGEMKSFSLKISFDNSNKNERSITWKLVASYEELGQAFKKELLMPEIKIISNMAVSAAAYYYSPMGDQLGSGPVPPLVGLPTNYWVFFDAVNSGNKLENLVVSAKLPAGVVFTGNKTLNSGDLTYNDKQRLIVWKLGALEANNSKHQAGFELQITPQSEQIGQSPLLLNALKYKARDIYCQEDLTNNLPAINTDLPRDPVNRGQGEVIN